MEPFKGPVNDVTWKRCSSVTFPPVSSGKLSELLSEIRGFVVERKSSSSFLHLRVCCFFLLIYFFFRHALKVQILDFFFFVASLPTAANLVKLHILKRPSSWSFARFQALNWDNLFSFIAEKRLKPLPLKAKKKKKGSVQRRGNDLQLIIMIIIKIAAPSLDDETTVYSCCWCGRCRRCRRRCLSWEAAGPWPLWRRPTEVEPAGVAHPLPHITARVCVCVSAVDNRESATAAVCFSCSATRPPCVNITKWCSCGFVWHTVNRATLAWIWGLC